MSSNDYRQIIGRNCNPAPIGIALFFLPQTFEQLEAEATNCNLPKRSSYNFIVDGCQVKETVPKENTAYSIPYPVCTVVEPEPCTEFPECFDGTTVLTGLASNVNPNCKVITIAISQATIGNCGECNECLVKLIADLLTEYSLDNSSETVFAYGNPEYDICPLIDCVQDALDAPVPVPNPNPLATMLCNTVSKLPSGIPETVVGKDANGKCVIGTTIPVLPTLTININITNPASPVFELLNGATVVSSTPLKELIDAGNNQHIGYIFP